ncbi:inorganic phosphate transporter [candidate division WOR-3 bacterium]|nr:inorganic phosphate transporter [candidate division WOR-3 bacterium]
MIWFFLTSGLFLGWSLGSNDTANIFGTAVGTRMVRFKVAALIASIFVILGAVFSGAGAAHTLGELGSINALGGAFTVALGAAITVAWMTKSGLPVSTTQAIIGAIVGWDFFSGAMVDTLALTKIVSTWVVSPILAGIFAFFIFKLLRMFLKKAKIHLLQIDNYTRVALIIIGAFGAYSLGANNIANVMGVFVTSNPFPGINIFGLLKLNDTQVLFLIGGLAIALGIYTYSRRVMRTVGSELYKLSPLAALVVVLAESLVLFIFASSGLEKLLLKVGLPTIPLVPVSSSQAVVGAIIGIGLARGGGRAINYRVFSKVIWGWFLTPISAGVITFFALFFMQNVFQQRVYKRIPYNISEQVVRKLEKINITTNQLKKFEGVTFYNSRKFSSVLKKNTNLNPDAIKKVSYFAEVDSILIDSIIAKERLGTNWFNRLQIDAIKKLHGKLFVHKWQLIDTLSSMTDEWKFLPVSRSNRFYNKELKAKYETIFHIFYISRVRTEEKNFKYLEEKSKIPQHSL